MPAVPTAAGCGCGRWSWPGSRKNSAWRSACATPRREVAHADLQAEFLREPGQLHLPQPQPAAVGTASIGGDQQPGGVRVDGLADLLPPAADRLHRERPGIGVGADVHPAGVGRHVIDPVGDGPAQLAPEVMHLHPFGLTARPPLLPAVLIVADQLLFLGVHADHRLPGGLELPHLLVDEPELPIPVRVLLSLHRLGVALQAVAIFFQQPPHRVRRHRMPRRCQLTSQLLRRLRRPPQRRLRITPGPGAHQPAQRRHQARIHLHRLGPPRPGPADPAIRLNALLQFPGAPAHRVRMNAGQLRHPLDPAPAQRPCLRSQQQPPLQLIQMRAHLRQHPREPVLIHHQLSHTTTVDNRPGQTCLILRTTLIYHFMFGPGYTAGCPSCSAIADGFDGSVVHLANHDVTLCAVSRAPLAKLQAYQRRMGWNFPWASSPGSDFNYDFQAAVTKEQWESGAVEYNFRATDFRPPAGQDSSGLDEFASSIVGTDWETYRREGPGVSAFALEDGVVYHTYSAYARGLDGLWGMYQWLDRAPRGRNETGFWWRRHDEYDSQ